MSTQDRWSALSMKDKAVLIKLMVKNGVSSIDEMRSIYNSDIDRAINATEHNFVQRLKDYPNTPKLDNGNGTFSTHSMASGEIDGKAIVYPTVQIDENGRLRRYPDGNDGNFEAMYRAIRTNDTLQMHPAIAPWYAENYKQFYNIPNEYSKGGSIQIKSENKGKFNATKKRTGKTTEELTHSKNPLTRKRAIFAQNAKRWKHDEGGPLNEINLYDGNTEESQQIRRRYNGKFITEDEYIQQQRNIITNAAIQKALNREVGIAPVLDNKYGMSCIYTATDNFGEKYRVMGNQTFSTNPERHGFRVAGPIDEEMPSNNIGKLYQIIENGTPNHMMLITGDDNGKPLVTYSRGHAKVNVLNEEEWNKDNDTIVSIFGKDKGKTYQDYINTIKAEEKADYVKNSHLWTVPTYETYEFIGTPEDNIKWKEEYNKLPLEPYNLERLKSINVPITYKKEKIKHEKGGYLYGKDGPLNGFEIPQHEYSDIIFPYDYDWFKYNQTLNRQRYAESSLLNNKKSPKGAKGPYQIMDITYKDYLTRGKGKPVDVNTLEGGEIVRNHVLNFMPKDLGDTWSDDSPEEVNQTKLYVGYNMGGNALKKYLKKQADKGIDIMNSLDWYNNLPYKEPKDYTDFIVFSKDVPDTSKTMQQYYEAWQKRGNGTFLENYPKKEEINWNLLQTLNK